MFFTDFCLSYPYEDQFLLFFIDYTPTPSDFPRFSIFVGVRNAVFAKFHSSYPYAERFSAFSAQRRGTTVVFRRCLRISILVFAPRVIVILIFFLEKVAGLGVARALGHRFGGDYELGEIVIGQQPDDFRVRGDILLFHYRSVTV